MNKNNFITANTKLDVISFLYFILFLFYLSVLLFLVLTSGSIKFLIFDNIKIIFLPLIIPIFLSFIGLRKFKFESNSKYFKFNSDCIFMSNISERFKQKLVLKKSDFSSNYEDSSFFGLKKELVLVSKKNHTVVKKKINVSFLTFEERKNLYNNLTFIEQ